MNRTWGAGIGFVLISCVGDDPSSGTTRAPNGADAGTALDAMASHDASDGGSDQDVQSGPSYCAALISHWTADGTPADAQNKNSLSWYPAATDGRYAPGPPGIPMYADTTIEPKEAWRIGRNLAGSPTYLESADAVGLQGLQELTYLGWGSSVKRDIANPFGAILCINGNSNTVGNGLCIARFEDYLQGGGLGVYLQGAKYDFKVNTSADPWSDGVYHFFGVTLRSKPIPEINVYWDGNPKMNRSAVVMDPILPGTTLPIRIGGDVPGIGGGTFNGLLDNLALFRRALTDGEIANIRAQGIHCR